MRGGTLDRMVAVQRVTITQSGSGEPQQSWQTLSTRPASIQYLTGAERFAAEQLLAVTQVAFVVRWAPAIADLSPLDRVIYPASALTASPPDLAKKIYDIVMVAEVGRHEALRIYCALQADQR